MPMSAPAAVPLSLPSPHLPCHGGSSVLSLIPPRNGRPLLPLSRRRYPYPSLRSTRPSSFSSSFSSDLASLVVTSSLLGDEPPRAVRSFLGPDAYDKLRLLEGFRRRREFQDGGVLEVRLMAAEEAGATAKLLAESFADSVLIPARYSRFLEFLVRQYVDQKRAQLPHAATLLGFFFEGGGDGAAEARLAATAEVSFNALGSNVSSPSPPPPRDAPYICNMTVEQSLRRRGIGMEMLRACEEVISEMRSGGSTEVYLHCRVIDEGPRRLYEKAGYSVVATDTFLAWLWLQQRKHLLRKQLAAAASSDDLPI